MKKYIEPEISVVTISAQQIICNSINFGNRNVDGSAGLARENDFYDETAQGGSIWDEEE